MSWISKIKSLFSKQKEELERPEIELGEVTTILNEKATRIDNEREKIKQLILERVQRFNKEISKNINEIKNLDVDKIKESDRLKNFVKDGLKGYLQDIINLIEDLKNAEKLPAEEYIQKIGQNITRFEKFSRDHFDKATILLGEGIAKAKENVHTFFLDLERIAEENAKFIEENKKILEINILFDKLDKSKKEKEKYDLEIKMLQDRSKNLDKQQIELDKELKETEESSDHEIAIKELEDNEKRKIDLKNRIQEIKKKIDFKSVSKFCHGNEKKTKIIKEYAENFEKAMREDSELKFVEIMKETGLNLNELEDIKKKLIELESIPVSMVIEKENRIKEKLRDNGVEKANIEKEIENKLQIKDKITNKIEESIKEIKLKINQTNS